MPTYEYVCEGCRKPLEVEQRITEPALKKCPKCGKLKLKRLVGTGNFILKGSGWYADLYSSPPPAAGKGKAESSEGGGESKAKDGDSKPKDGETKPAAKEPAKKSKNLSSKGKN